MRYLIGLIVYLIAVSLLISYMATGMGYTVGAISLDIGTNSSTGIAAIDVLGYSANLIGVMLQCITLTLPEEVLPLWANILFIKTAFVGVIIGIVDLVLP